MTRAYTTIEQSRKLAEILPLESADMRYAPFGDTHPWVWDEEVKLLEKGSIPCWSLAALLGVLPKIVNNETLFIETSAALWHIGYRNIYTARADNPVDACVAMVGRLHELKML